jgi:hypothetical protein
VTKTSPAACWRAALVAVVLGFALTCAAQQRGEASESTVKAAFLYKFAGYVEWPPGLFAAADTPFVIAVTGSDEIAAELVKIVAGRSIAGHPVAVKRLREGEALRGAHLLFAGRETPRLAALLKAAQQQGVLAVTEAERGLELGSAINFVVADDRVGFEVSLDSAEKSGHRISSRMLAVARRVVPRT